MMECNKEEALHAKEIALRKLKTKDFLGAKRIALKAQRLYPKLESLSQLLTICEVHCAAEVKVNGYMDWYGILQVEATADETIIRNGYEKLAFLLLPGKNSLPSAQAAFNLISEAHTILCDHVKRSRYDIKIQCGPREISKETIWPSDCGNKRDVVKHIPPFDCVKVFWTICPHCRKRFVYYQRNLMIRCEGCSKHFFAFKLHEEAVPSRFLAAPNNSQLPSKMFASQKHGVHNPQVRHSKLYPSEGNEPMMHARQRDEHVEGDGRSNGHQEGSCSETRGVVVQYLATNLIHSPAPSVIECTKGRMMQDPPDPHLVATQNLCMEGASATVNDAGSDSVRTLGKRKQGDGANSHSRDSYNKRVRKYNSLSDADSGSDKRSSDNIADTDGQSTEHLSKVDSQGDENATHEGDASYSYDKMFNGSIARIDSQPAEHCPSKVDSQGGGNATLECNTNHSDDKVFNGSVASADNLSTEHLQNEVGIHGDGNAMLLCNVNSGNDEICNGNIASSSNESAEYLPTSREMDTQGDGNTTYDGTANCEDIKLLNDSLATVVNQSIEYLSSKVDIQMGDGNSSHEGNANCDRGKMPNDNVVNSNNQSSEHHHREVDSQGDGNATHEDNSNYSCDKMFNDNIAGIDNQSAEHCASKVDSQGGGNATLERNTNHSDDKMFNGSVASAENLSTEHLPNKVGIQGDGGNAMLLCNVSSGNDEICDGNIGSSSNESAEYLNTTREMDTQGDGNTTYDGTSNCGDIKLLNDSLATAVNQSTEFLSSKVDIQRGDGNTSHEGNANCGRGKMSNDIVVDSNNQSSEHHHREVDSQGDGNATHKRSASSDTVSDQGNINSEATDTVGEKSCYSRCPSMPTDLNTAFPSVTLESYKSPGSMLADLGTDDSTSVRMSPGTEHITLEKHHGEAHLPMENRNNISSEEDTSLQEDAHGAIIKIGDGSSQHNSLFPITFTYPESAFHDFEELRSCAKFEPGQIWALYSDVDAFPNFYGWVNEVEVDPFRVHLTWLEACHKGEQEEQWLEQGIAPSCGTFEVNFDWTATYDTTYVFSHVVNVRKTRKKWPVEIRPRVGEVWAIYLNWSPDSAPSSSQQPEYAIGEIKWCSKSSTVIEFLTKVDGYVAVFKHDHQKGALNIPVAENLRFSHQIPAFRLTKENGGELRGFYELDPAAVPEAFLSE